MIQLGAAYYPELWDENETEQDIERCRAYGLRVLRVGEFAWGRTGPRGSLTSIGSRASSTASMRQGCRSFSAPPPAPRRAGF